MYGLFTNVTAKLANLPASMFSFLSISQKLIFSHPVSISSLYLSNKTCYKPWFSIESPWIVRQLFCDELLSRLVALETIYEESVAMVSLGLEVEEEARVQNAGP